VDIGPRPGVTVLGPMNMPVSRTKKAATSRLSGILHLIGAGLAVMSVACAATPAKKPNEPLITGEPSWPDDIKRQAERADRACAARESQLLAAQQEAKDEQQKFKTMLGSITGGVGTVGGVIGGVGAFAINSPDDVKTITGVTGFISGGLGAVGSVVTALYDPGADKIKSSTESLAAIQEKKAAARDLLKAKDPASWSDSEKEAWAKASKDLEAACK
jgi:hypothetical protein